MIFGCLVFMFLLLLLYFSYAYHLTLVIAVFTLVVLGVLMAQQKGRQVKVEYQFELTPQGICTFDGETYFQLQTSSRLSFLGCWLTLIPITAKNTFLANKHKQLFIYRDSLCEQDFSRISRVLKDLGSSSISAN